MATYRVVVEKTTREVIKVEANSMAEAESKVEDMDTEQRDRNRDHCDYSHLFSYYSVDYRVLD